MRLHTLCYIDVTKLLHFIINVSFLFPVISVMLQKTINVVMCIGVCVVKSLS